MKMKGITPVVAVILLLLVTISMAAFAFGVFQRIFGLAGTAGETATLGIVSAAAQRIAVDNVPTLSSVVLRNVGTADVPHSSITIYSNDVLETCDTWIDTSGSSAAIEPNTIATCDWAGNNCDPGEVLKVFAPGSQVSFVCQ
jgi:flagellin-like protein